MDDPNLDRILSGVVSSVAEEWDFSNTITVVATGAPSKRSEKDSNVWQPGALEDLRRKCDGKFITKIAVTLKEGVAPQLEDNASAGPFYVAKLPEGYGGGIKCGDRIVEVGDEKLQVPLDDGSWECLPADEVKGLLDPEKERVVIIERYRGPKHIWFGYDFRGIEVFLDQLCITTTAGDGDDTLSDRTVQSIRDRIRAADRQADIRRVCLKGGLGMRRLEPLEPGALPRVPNGAVVRVLETKDGEKARIETCPRPVTGWAELADLVEIPE